MNTANPIEVWVPGIPQPGGSKTAFRHYTTGRMVVKDACKKNPAWKDTVKTFAVMAYRGAPLTTPLHVQFEFYVMRPQGHYGTGRNAGQVRSSAPTHPAVKPDVTKLVRSTEDALTGILWRDDTLIVKQVATKAYADKPGVRITVSPAAV